MENNYSFLPVKIQTVHSKTEIATLIDIFIQTSKHTDTEKYVILKDLERIAKEGITRLQPKAIEDMLNSYQGETKVSVLGAEVQITNERKDITRAKYTYSDEVYELERLIQQDKDNVKLMEDKLKLIKSIEINNNTAKMDIITENEPPKWGIKVTLAK